MFIRPIDGSYKRSDTHILLYEILNRFMTFWPIKYQHVTQLCTHFDFGPKYFLFPLVTWMSICQAILQFLIYVIEFNQLIL